MFALVLTTFLLYSVNGQDIPIEDNVLVLSTDNFQSAIDSSSMVLVEFYAPWCGHCKKLSPEYAEAATKLLDSGIKLAKVDVTENKELGTQFGVKGYPTLKFFKNGEAQEYTGGRTADTIVSWLEKKSGASSTALTSKDQAQEFLADNKVTVVGFFKDPAAKEAKAFTVVADKIDDVVFAVTDQQEVFDLFNIVDDAAVIMLKKFDEGRNNIVGDITEETVTDFVTSNYLPLVVDFNTDTAKMIFQGDVKNHLIMFLSAKDEKFEYIMHAARKVANDLKGDVMFVSVTTDEPEHSKVVGFFGIEQEELPTFRVTISTDDMAKYKPENADLTEDNMRNFIKMVKDGEVSPHLKSEDQPSDWDSLPTKVLVSSNFNDVAMDVSKDVLVEFYAPWCGHCKKLAPIWEELGDHFKDNDKIAIAKIDMTANELENVKVRGFPTIKLFKAGTNEQVDYTGGRSLADFIKFLEPEEVKAEETKDEL